MSEPPPPYDTSTVVETVRAEIRDSTGTLVAYFGGPLIDLAGNVPAGGSYVLIEPLDAEPNAALLHAAEMEDIVVSAGITLEQVHHGYGPACWAVNRRGLERGHGIRTGLEDITLLPDGRPARDNADLVAAAARLIRTRVPL